MEENVQDAGDTVIPDDVREKILRFAKAGISTAWMRGKSYLSMGGCSMGIAGSIVNNDFSNIIWACAMNPSICRNLLVGINLEIYDKKN